MKASIAALFFLISSAAWSGSVPALTAFFPAGSHAILTRVGIDREVVSGVPLDCVEGSYTLHITHPDYQDFYRTVLVGPTDVVIFPEMEISTEYRAAQIATLRIQKQKVQSDRDALIAASVFSGAVALAGWATAGGLEYLIATKKTDLFRVQKKYQAASAGEAPALWADVQDLKSDIYHLRAYENGTIAASGLISIGSLMLLFSAPEPKDWDDAIQASGGSVE